MLLLEVTYHCMEYDETTGRQVEGENCCRLRVKDGTVCRDGRVRLAPSVGGWLEDAIAAVERLQDRKYIYGSICDIRLAKKKEG